MIFYEQYSCVKKQGKNCQRSASKEMCLIASIAQLNDVFQFCAVSKRGFAEVFSVDLTFKLGEFYVLVTSFKNPMLINKLGKQSHRGPAQIQQQSSKCFCYFGEMEKQ